MHARPLSKFYGAHVCEPINTYGIGCLKHEEAPGSTLWFDKVSQPTDVLLLLVLCCNVLSSIFTRTQYPWCAIVYFGGFYFLFSSHSIYLSPAQRVTRFSIGRPVAPQQSCRFPTYPCLFSGPDLDFWKRRKIFGTSSTLLTLDNIGICHTRKFQNLIVTKTNILVGRDNLGTAVYLLFSNLNNFFILFHSNLIWNLFERWNTYLHTKANFNSICYLFSYKISV